jgi:hypothetical protein
MCIFKTLKIQKKFENCFKILELQKSFTIYKWVIIYMMGESKKKGSRHAKVKVLFKDYIFHTIFKTEFEI